MIKYRVEDIRSFFKDLHWNGDVTPDKTGSSLYEIIGINFIADESYIFGKPNDEYINREIEWYKSQSLNVNDIPGKVPAIWEQVSDKNGYINSNYGWCIYNKHNYHQYDNVLKLLKQDPYTRRAVMIYTRPSMWEDYNKNGMSDFMCTNTVQYFLRNGRLDALVQMRSNDVVFGYKNDFAWQDYVLNNLCQDLGVDKGTITWSVGSLHVYERHFHLISE